MDYVSEEFFEVNMAVGFSFLERMSKAFSELESRVEALDVKMSTVIPAVSDLITLIKEHDEALHVAMRNLNVLMGIKYEPKEIN